MAMIERGSGSWLLPEDDENTRLETTLPPAEQRRMRVVRELMEYHGFRSAAREFGIRWAYHTDLQRRMIEQAWKHR